MPGLPGQPGTLLHRFAQLPAALFSFPEGRRLLERIAAERHRHLRQLAVCLAASIATPDKAALLADLFQPEECGSSPPVTTRRKTTPAGGALPASPMATARGRSRRTAPGWTWPGN